MIRNVRPPVPPRRRPRVPPPAAAPRAPPPGAAAPPRRPPGPPPPARRPPAPPRRLPRPRRPRFCPRRRPVVAAAVAEDPPSPVDKDEDYMAEAMSPLPALRNSENPDEETSRQVREIQDRFRVLEEDACSPTKMTTPASPPRSTTTRARTCSARTATPASRETALARATGSTRWYPTAATGGAPHTELPHYPTPWELWKKAHESKVARGSHPHRGRELGGKTQRQREDTADIAHAEAAQAHCQGASWAQLQAAHQSAVCSMAAENIKLYEGNRLKHVVKSKAEKIAKA